LGDHTENFLAPLGEWERRDYECHWIEAAERLLKGAERTAFITAAFQFWWPMWSEGADIFVQEQLLWLVPSAGQFERSNPYAAVGARVSISDDGQPVSEWRLGIADIDDFVRRRRASTIPA
jgi:hypothetical protein